MIFPEPTNPRLTKSLGWIHAELLRVRVRRHYTSRELGSWNGSTEKRGNWKYWANWPRKNTASIFYEPSQLFRHNERVYGRNYAKLYAATRSPVQLGNARHGDRGKGKSVCTRFSPSIREVGTVETVFIDRRTHRKWLGDGVPCSSYSVELITEPWNRWKWNGPLDKFVARATNLSRTRIDKRSGD